MRLRIAFASGVAIGLLCFSPLALAVDDQGKKSPAVESGGGKDVFFLIDVTGSMVGLPVGSGNPDILGRILRRVVEHVEFDCSEGDRLFVATFQDRLHDIDGPAKRFEKVRSFAMQQELQSARDYILAIEQGVREEKNPVPRTGIYDSVGEILSLMEAERSAREARIGNEATYSQRLVLFTDGEENVSPHRLPSILEQYELLREESHMGNRIFFKCLVYGPSKGPFESDPSGGLVVEMGNPDQPIQVPVQVVPEEIDLGNVFGRSEVSIGLAFSSAPSALGRVRLSLEDQDSAVAEVVALRGTDLPVKDGRCEAVLTFPKKDAVDAALRTGVSSVPFRAVLRIQPDSHLIQLSPSTVRIRGVFSGSREILVTLPFRRQQLDAPRAGGGVSRFMKKGSDFPLASFRFSTLAEKDSLELGIERVRGVDPKKPALLVGGAEPSRKVVVGSTVKGISLRLPDVECIDNGPAVYSFEVSAPRGVTLVVQTLDGQHIEPASPGAAVRVPLPVIAEGFSPCELKGLGVAGTVAKVFAGVGALLAGIFGWFAFNRPRRSLMLAGEGLMMVPLRQAQGFFSNWASVGSGPRDHVKSGDLPPGAFRVRATRTAGTRVQALVDGLGINGTELKKGSSGPISNGADLQWSGPSGEKVSIRIEG